MEVLRHGDTGKNVKLWQNFLRGQGYLIIVDGVFGEKTETASKEFQTKYKLSVDGVIGNKTFAKAMQLGFELVPDKINHHLGPNWPPKSNFPLSSAQRQKLFGPLKYKSAGTKNNPEAIIITNNWQKDNLEFIEIPQLIGIKGTGKAKKFAFHKLAAFQIQKLFSVWEQAGLHHLILSWGGSWAPRFIRGSHTILSNHSFATAFDINVPWNLMGTQPALVGKKGSVRLLVPIACHFGMYWGGHFTRKDGMHFEVAKIMSKDEVNNVCNSISLADEIDKIYDLKSLIRYYPY